MSDQNYLPFPKGFSTKAIHAGQEPEQWSCNSVVPPISMSTIFKQDASGNSSKYVYSRAGNPSRDTLQKCLGALENTEYALCFSSGLGANAVLLGILQPGDHGICGDDVYGGTNRLFRQFSPNVEWDFVDSTDLKKLEDAIKPNTKLIYIESPTNPLMKVTDIKAVSELAKKRNILFAVDNTFLTPYLQRPLDLGADFSVYSVTKYINGHSDIMMGAIVTKNKEYYEKLVIMQRVTGNIPSPFDCFQVNRSLKTLSLRMQKHTQNALTVGKFLESHPKVIRVLHPGLPSHPQHDLTKKQTSGHSGMFGFYIKGDCNTTKKFLNGLKVFITAGSLGGVQSSISVPAQISHSSMSEEERQRLQITDNYIRVSVGIEDEEDLIDDLKRALDAC